MMYRNLSIASIMLLILLPHFSNGRVGMGLGESDLQAQHQGEDELWEAQFIAERSALVARMKKEQLEKQRDESRKLQIVASEYAEKRMRLHKSGKTHAPTGSPTVPVPPTTPVPVPPTTPSPMPATPSPMPATPSPTAPPTSSTTKAGKSSPGSGSGCTPNDASMPPGGDCNNCCSCVGDPAGGGQECSTLGLCACCLFD